MSLFVYQSNRLEKLVRHLATHALKEPLSSLFAAEQIVVGSQGMAQWLKLELAKTTGFVAHLELPFPRAFIAGLIEKVVTADARSGAIEPDALTWRILGSLDGLLAHSAFRDLRNYLSTSEDPRRKFQLAERLAALLDQYSVYRPRWIAEWQNGQEPHWQAILWRTVMTDGLACQGKFLYELIQALNKPDCDLTQLPERLSIFAPAILPPSYLQVFEVLAKHIPVHLFCFSPSSEYWGDLVTPGEAARIQSALGGQGVDPQDLHLDRVNPLLASCGKTGRSFQQLITDLEATEEEVDLFEKPGQHHLLACIQSSILTLEDEPKPAEKTAIQPGDRSVQVHSCHSPLRELEVLRNHLLDWFSTDPTLSPQDILVMLTDIEAYAPYIKGVFDDAEPGAPAIPYTLADRGARQESALIDGFIALLQLSSGRLTATGVADFFETEAVHRRFGVLEEELEQVRLWIQNAAIRWGRNGEHRTQLGLPRFKEHTWEYGCNRLLLGYAMADGENVLVQDHLPCEGIEGTATALLGRWLDFLRQLYAALDELAKPNTLEGWSTVLNRVFEALFQPALGEERAVNAIGQVLAGLREQQRVSGFNQLIPLSVVLERILPKLEENQPGRAFLRGAVTFCGLNPMRSIPFRVVCLLGMQDRSFPRNPAPLSFDLMARNPEIGDESRREDDRYLFLESLLAARDCLYISYVGQSVRDNTSRPASVVVSELLDFIASRFRLAGAPDEGPGEEPGIIKHLLLTIHRLHTFSPTYFLPNDETNRRLFSCSRASARISQVLVDPSRRLAVDKFLPAPLGSIDEQLKTISLKELEWFMRNPSRYFVEKRLEFRLPEVKELLVDEEPFSLDGLVAYQYKQEVLDALFSRRPTSRLIAGWRGSGNLPPGPVGTSAVNGLMAAVDPLLRQVQDRVGSAQLTAVPFELKLGDYILEGQLLHFPGVGLVRCRAAKVEPKKKGPAHLWLWIEHLVYQLIGGPESKQSWLIGEDGTWVFRNVPEAERLLCELLELYVRGLTAPLPFFPKSAFAYVFGPSPKSKKSPEDFASDAWVGDDDNEYSEGEQDDPYFNLCFRNDPNPLGPEFQQLARQVVNPIANHQSEEETP
jgi:exodeoxyribonuclease V gamma subunit